MNAYTLINKLRKARRRHGISAGAQALYYELLAINNDEDWSETFKCTASDLFGPLGVSEKTLGVYREELIRAELIGYISGKSKRTASTYSLHGSSFDTMIDSNIYYQYEHQTEHQMVEKTPDLKKTKIKSKTKYEEAVEYLSEREIDLNSNASFDPKHTHLPDSKEKNCAKKEKKPLPKVEEAIAAVSEVAYWRHVLEHYKQSETDRQALFKIFYEQREDFYNVRLPTWRDIAQHFYNWVPIHLSKDSLKKLNGNAIAKSTIHTTNTKAYGTSAKDKRAELLSLNQQSGEILRRADH